MTVSVQSDVERTAQAAASAAPMLRGLVVALAQENEALRGQLRAARAAPASPSLDVFFHIL